MALKWVFERKLKMKPSDFNVGNVTITDMITCMQSALRSQKSGGQCCRLSGAMTLQSRLWSFFFFYYFIFINSRLEGNSQDKLHTPDFISTSAFLKKWLPGSGTAQSRFPIAVWAKTLGKKKEYKCVCCCCVLHSKQDLWIKSSREPSVKGDLELSEWRHG